MCCRHWSRGRQQWSRVCVVDNGVALRYASLNAAPLNAAPLNARPSADNEILAPITPHPVRDTQGLFVSGRFVSGAGLSLVGPEFLCVTGLHSPRTPPSPALI